MRKDGRCLFVKFLTLDFFILQIHAFFEVFESVDRNGKKARRKLIQEARMRTKKPERTFVDPSFLFRFFHDCAAG